MPWQGKVPTIGMWRTHLINKINTCLKFGPRADTFRESLPFIGLLFCKERLNSIGDCLLLDCLFRVFNTRGGLDLYNLKVLEHSMEEV